MRLIPRGFAVPPARHPIEFALPVALMLLGLSVFLGQVEPGSFRAQLDPAIITLWGAGLAIGGLLTLIAWFWKIRSTGIFIEQVGAVFISSASLIYSVSLLLKFGPVTGGVAAGVFLVICGAYASRWFQLQNLLREVNVTIEETTL